MGEAFGHTEMVFRAGVVEVWWTGVGVDTVGVGPVPSAEDWRGGWNATGTHAGTGAARAWVRETLARRLEVSVDEVRIVYDPHGKPHLDPTLNLSFSVSHCDGFAALALGSVDGLGVDIEPSSRRVRAGTIERLLSAAERAPLEGLSRRAQERALLEHWTLREAVAKALGTGLGANLQRMEILEGPEGPRLRDESLSHIELRRWQPSPEVIGAVALAAR